MAEEHVRRRLAAILAADVVGYSRLMEQDESATLAALKARRREILEPLLARHQGRIFKFTGDGVFVEFGSAVSAVHCAIELQQGMAAANAGLPQTHHLILRIGINLGDVMVEGSDLYGDGVNIAARLEAIAEPGGILVSSTAFDHVKNKVKVGLQELGIQTLKNIAEPIRIYRVFDTPQVAITKGMTDKPSVAVLPFSNMSGDQEQQYFSDGITEDIITELSRFRSLLVIARNSSFQYRAATDVKRISRELGVQYLVEGSVRRSSNRLRITAQLVDATGNHLWAEHYDREAQDIFAVQNEVAQAIVATIEGRMAASGAERSRRKPTNDLMAYDCFLQAREAIERRGDSDAALFLLRRAIELDPRFAQAHAWLARVYTFKFHVDLQPETLNEAIALARKAISLDEADALGHSFLGHAYTIAGQLDLAGLHHTRAVFLNPMDVRITSARAVWLANNGRGDEAVRCLDADLQRDPFPPVWYWDFRGIALFVSGRYEEAIEALSHLTTVYWFDNYYLAASYAQLGLIERARACAAEILRERPGFALKHVGMTEHFKHPADLHRLLDGLRKAGLPE